MEQHTKIAILENEFEAQILKSLLEEQDIDYYFKTYYDTAYDGLFQRSNGWGAVYAPKKYEKVILELIDDIRRQETENNL